MENYQGDLTDILRGAATTNNTHNPDPVFNNLVKFQSSQEEEELLDDDFGDPFSHMQEDPLRLFDNNKNSNTSSTFFLNSSDAISAVDRDEEDDQMMMLMRPSSSCSSSSCDVFSRVLQISPTAVNKSPVITTTPEGESRVHDTTSLINVNNNNNNGLQICSPRNPAIKRRKSQAKKVVCIPAPAPVNSRASGEIVPSDLWAWRKYGQKPIKGSPYPRGYYRCSSSKGCSARKQVERSRTDPNMLVITYTSEHNHPWPTQRNALAGSTRAQPSKANAQKTNDLNEELNDTNFDVSVSTSTNAHVKDEIRDLDMDMDEGFSPIYKPTMPDSNLNSCDEFFAELEEIETDPIRILLNQDHEENDQIKGLDPFTIFDWSGHTKRNL